MISLHRASCSLRLPGTLLVAAILFFLSSLPAPARGETEEEFNLDRQRAPEESLFDLIFGSPPPVATQRGILLIDAFLDANGNGRRDRGESDLAGAVQCTLDGIDYTIPAFIPGLEYEGSYQLACSSAAYRPSLDDPDIFISQRGEIVRLDIPCRPGPASAGGS